MTKSNNKYEQNNECSHIRVQQTKYILGLDEPSHEAKDKTQECRVTAGQVLWPAQASRQAPRRAVYDTRHRGLHSKDMKTFA